MPGTKSDRNSYWANFYSQEDSLVRLKPPSQFAAFVAQEIEPASAVFDVGCGNGRDSLFFAALGFKVTAMDLSESAIAAVLEEKEQRRLSNMNCEVGDVAGSSLVDAIAALAERNACIYARFFLHAITEEEQAHFFKTLSSQLQTGHKLAFEYRTLADEFLQKDAQPHFRRYQSSQSVNDALAKLGFTLIYETEGQGYAKYRNEDAIVARGIYQKT